MTRLAFRGRGVKNSKPNWSRRHAYGRGFKDGLTSTWVKDIRQVAVKKETQPPAKPEEKKPAGRKILHAFSVPFNTIFNKLLGWGIKSLEKPASEFKKDHKYINGALEVLTLWPAYVGLVALGKFISS